MADRTPPWIDEIPNGAFITTEPSYETGKYFDRFRNDQAEGLKYYFFDLPAWRIKCARRGTLHQLYRRGVLRFR